MALGRCRFEGAEGPGGPVAQLSKRVFPHGLRHLRELRPRGLALEKSERRAGGVPRRGDRAPVEPRGGCEPFASVATGVLAPRRMAGALEDGRELPFHPRIDPLVGTDQAPDDEHARRPRYAPRLLEHTTPSRETSE